MPDVEAARRFCDETILLVSRPAKARVLADRAEHVRAGMSALARCRSLLIAIVTLDRAECADVIGVSLRAELEAWYFGVIALLGTSDDFDHLAADNRKWKNKLAQHWPGVHPEAGTERTFTVRARAERAGDLMSEVGESPNGPLDWYLEYYAAESLTNAHAGASSLSPYLFEAPDGTIGINNDPEVDERLRYGRLLFAAVLVILLARWVYVRAGIDTIDLDNLELPDN